MTIVIPIAPVAKGRPQFTKNGQTYTPKKTRDYEDMVRFVAQAAKIRAVTGAVSMTVQFYMPIPKSWSKAKKQRAESGEIRPATKPDATNLVKAIEDGLNGVAYTDDSQIVDLTVHKYYGKPRTVITIEEVEHEPETTDRAMGTAAE